MKTNIAIWHKEKEVFSIYTDEKLHFLPLEKGDKFYMNFEEISPKDVSILKGRGFKKNYIRTLIKETDDKNIEYGYGRWKVVNVHKSFRIEFDSEDVFTVEYQIKKVIKIYWKFWRLYKWKQFWKNLFKSK